MFSLVFPDHPDSSHPSTTPRISETIRRLTFPRRSRTTGLDDRERAYGRLLQANICGREEKSHMGHDGRSGDDSSNGELAFLSLLLSLVASSNSFAGAHASFLFSTVLARPLHSSLPLARLLLLHWSHERLHFASPSSHLRTFPPRSVELVFPSLFWVAELGGGRGEEGSRRDD